MAYGVMKAVAYARQHNSIAVGQGALPGPFEALIASSPIKKSRSSIVPFLEPRWPEGPAPPVRKDGLFATAGRPDPEPAWLPAPAPSFVAMAVGNTNDGESFPAKPGRSHQHVKGLTACRIGRRIVPSLEKPVPLSITRLAARLQVRGGGSSLVHDNGRSLVRHSSQGTPRAQSRRRRRGGGDADAGRAGSD